jgi:hypothetical protein
MIFPSVHYGGRLPELTFVRTGVNTGNFSAYSFTATDIGDPHPSRLIVLAVIGEWTSVTVNGVSATRIATALGNNNERSINLYQAHVPTGTIVPVSLTSSFSHLSCLIGVWKILYLRSLTALDTDTVQGAPTGNMSLNVATNGPVIAANVFTIGGSVSFSGVTKNYEIDSDDNYESGGGSRIAASTGTLNLSYTCPDAGVAYGVCASWR